MFFFRPGGVPTIKFSFGLLKLKIDFGYPCTVYPKNVGL